MDTLSIREKTPEVPADELLTAACQAVRFLRASAHTRGDARPSGGQGVAAAQECCQECSRARGG